MRLLEAGPAPAIADEHSVLLWQTCAYADDLSDAVRSGRPVSEPHEALLAFAHYRLLPYLSAEERRLPPTRLRDEHLVTALLGDHERIRVGVDDLEGGGTRRLLGRAAQALVVRLDRHVRREQTWIPAGGDPGAVDLEGWALPLVLGEDIDVDALPEAERDRLLLQRLARMRPGEVVRLESGRDLHALWRCQNRLAPGAHVWVYEQDGPDRHRVRVTRRDADDG